MTLEIRDFTPLHGLTRAETMERAMIFHALRRTRAGQSGRLVNKMAASRWIGISVAALYLRLKVYEKTGHPITVESRSRQRTGPTRSNKNTPTLLRLLPRLGLSNVGGRKGRFWNRSDETLQELLDEANAARLKLISEHHPDRNGDTAKAAEINATWRAVRKIFKQRGFTATRSKWKQAA